MSRMWSMTARGVFPLDQCPRGAAPDVSWAYGNSSCADSARACIIARSLRDANLDQCALRAALTNPPERPCRPPSELVSHPSHREGRWPCRHPAESSPRTRLPDIPPRLEMSSERCRKVAFIGRSPARQPGSWQLQPVARQWRERMRSRKQLCEVSTDSSARSDSSSLLLSHSALCRGRRKACLAIQPQ